MGDEAIVLKYAVTAIDRERLELHYRIDNGSERVLYLFTPLLEPGEEKGAPAPQKVYAFLDPEGVLQITKRLWLLPEDVDVYSPDVPLLTEVGPGRHFEESLSLALPIRIDYPYLGAGEEEPEGEPELMTAEARGIALSIGYLFGDEVPGRMESIGAPGGVGFVVGYGIAAERQRILQGQALSVRAPVQDFKR